MLPMGNPVEPPRVLVSVSDDTGLQPFLQGLQQLGWEIWATEGTARRLEAAGLSVRPLSAITGMVSLLGGRVKSLHPAIFAGVLARPDPSDLEQLRQVGAVPFDLVVVNFYPFATALSRVHAPGEVPVESIDIGGPALVRAAAKNFDRVGVLCRPDQYPPVLEELRAGDGRTLSTDRRRRLAAEAFAHTAVYDEAIAAAFAPTATKRPATGEASPLPERLELRFQLWQKARYGENPHQLGAIYRTLRPVPGSVVWGRQVQGKELSYNNVADAAAAWAVVAELADLATPAVCAVKHGTPCGVAVGASLHEAYQRAHDADPVSIFGGVVALNRPVDGAAALAMSRTFLEVVVAPAFTPEALEELGRKPNLRLLEVGEAASGAAPGDAGAGDAGAGDAGTSDAGSPYTAERLEVRSIDGGLLVQTPDREDLQEAALRVVTRATPTSEALQDLRFAWRVVKHVRSNAIVVAAQGQTLGIGGGQVNRIDAARIALEKAGERARGAVLASDGFFPFADVVEAAAQAGIAAIIQPGGSVRDHESITAADRAGLAMVFTGIRHFRH